MTSCCWNEDLESAIGDSVAEGDELCDESDTFSGECSEDGGRDISYRWTPPETGTYCVDTEECDGLDNDCDGSEDEDPGAMCLDNPECAGGLCICTIGPFGDYICVPD